IPSLHEQLDAVLLHLYVSGTAPTNYPPFKNFLASAKNASVPILAITERDDEVKKLGTYPSGKILMKNNCLWCADLTPEAAFVKFWILRELHSHQSKPEFYSWLSKNWIKAISDEIVVPHP